MPYFPITEQVDTDNSHGWQLRIHISDRDITRDSQKVELIKKIVKETLAEFPLDAKIYAINSDEEHDNEYDGALSKKGSDRTQRGKEVCIYMPNSGEVQPTTKEYQLILLTLWKKLAEAHIELEFHTPPGDRAILMDGGFPTPFSFTSETADQEWRNKHGILNKEFKGYDQNHPILGLAFSMEDLLRLGIPYEADNILHQQFIAIDGHRRLVDSRLDQFVSSMGNDFCTLGRLEDFWQEKENAEDEHPVLLKCILKILPEYQAKFRDAQIEDRSTVMDAFKKELRKFKGYQKIIDGYPKEFGSVFQEGEAISYFTREIHPCDEPELVIEKFQKLNEIKQSEEAPGKTYKQRIDEIKTDFRELFAANPDVALNGTIQTWYERQVDAHPSQMQVAYRRTVFLLKEEKAVLQAKEQMEKYHDNILDYVIKGIQKYKDRPRGIRGSHLSWASACFDSKKGERRAVYFLNLLEDTTLTKEKKLMIAYALLATQNGIQLKKDVTLGMYRTNLPNTQEFLKVKMISAWRVPQERKNDFLAEMEKVVKNIIEQSTQKTTTQKTSHHYFWSKPKPSPREVLDANFATLESSIQVWRQEAETQRQRSEQSLMG